jgi:antitoxin HicB
MDVAYRYRLEPEDNGWWLVRFPDVPEALTEGETEADAHAAAADCLIAALEGYVKAGRAVPRPTPPQPGESRAMLPELAATKLAESDTM